ncbi:MAG: hypothetical protein WBJ10_14900 [Daejeonella sp.]|uniref:hypothetical protein n=1 Tax=Daejeonella sp. TaxID=2805397 RepID=UPI003C78563A
MKKCLLTLSLITIISFVAQAQVINAAISSSVNATVTGTPDIAAFATDSDIENGLITAPVNFAVKSNRLWKLTTTITGIVGTPITGGPGTIEAPLLPSNIAWGVINGADGTPSSFTTFSATVNTPTQAKTGTRGSALVSGNTFTLRYKVTPGFAVDPGTYAVSVTHTVSAQ